MSEIPKPETQPPSPEQQAVELLTQFADRAIDQYPHEPNIWHETFSGEVTDVLSAYDERTGNGVYKGTLADGKTEYVFTTSYYVAGSEYRDRGTQYHRWNPGDAAVTVWDKSELRGSSTDIIDDVKGLASLQYDVERIFPPITEEPEKNLLRRAMDGLKEQVRLEREGRQHRKRMKAARKAFWEEERRRQRE